ncbi:energy-coupling factor transporter transmembrane component T [Shewanella atlantica]|uniref:Energy-coupling factor transporter transmembrane protein EcfT n=1 Tax=Shewanella atlantica TaxID=271099 RepID=A0A431VXB3_9GAMM|nr:energy-coupling factor transporter transmembrane component T [Shewanella atlantica]RTR27932.1 energy-coupling factor transporter transmembrane protein EcfT [Shewanella atlantica]
MQVKGRRKATEYRRATGSGNRCLEGSAAQKSSFVTAASLILVLFLSSAAFFIPDRYLPGLILCDIFLVIHGLSRRGKLGVIVRVFLVQLIITMSLYYLIHGQGQLAQGALAVLRILLAFIPGWWLSVSCRAERIGEVLTWILPVKWAFVIAASIRLLPFMTVELREIYQIQCLRGARITPKFLRDPRNWPELINCVIFPLLIQLLKLSRQVAVAAQLRYFGKNKKPTHWR